MKQMIWKSTLFLTILSLTPSWAAPLGPQDVLRPGDVIKISLATKNPAKIEANFNFAELGHERSIFILNKANGRLETLLEVPQAGSRFYLELHSKSYHSNYLNVEEDLKGPKLAAEILGAKEEKIVPKVSGIHAKKIDGTHVELSLDVETAAPLEFVGIDVTGEFKVTEGPNRVFVALTDNVSCDNKTPIHCVAKIELPEEIPGTPALSVTVENKTGGEAYLSSTKKDFDFDWKHRNPTLADLQEPIIEHIKLVAQHGRETEISFDLLKVESVKRVGINLKVEDGVRTLFHGKEEVPGSMNSSVDKLTFTCDKSGHCDAKFQLPEYLASRNVKFDLLVTAINEQLAFTPIPEKTFDLSVIPIDQEIPEVASVVFEPATPDDIKNWQKEYKEAFPDR